MKKEQSTDALLGRVVHIIGPLKLQNALLGFFLGQKAGARCLTGEDFKKVQTGDGAGPDERPLVLLDSFGRDLESILVQIESSGQNVLSGAYVALFNVDPGKKLEEDAVMRGIRGFFYESDSPEPLLKGVEAIFEGEFWVSRTVMSKCLMKQKSREKVASGAAGQLTPREIDILAMVAVGVKNEEIAGRLCISPHTVKTHIYNIFKKIGVPNRLQAALWAARNL